MLLTDTPQAFARLPRADYDAIDAINSSLLKVVSQKSEFHGWAAFRNPDREEQEDKAAYRVGTLLHMALLEPAEFAKVEISKLGPETKGFAAARVAGAARGVLVAQEKEHAHAQSMAKAVLTHSALGGWFHSEDPAVMDAYLALNELTLTWLDPLTKLRCKARLDALRLMAGSTLYAFDLKTALSADPGEFGRAAGKNGYLLQGAFYNDALFYCKSAVAELLGIDPVSLFNAPQVFEFVAIEKPMPCASTIARYFMDEEHIQLGRHLYREALNRVAASMSTGYWPGYSTEAHPLEIPPYFFKK